METSDYPVIEPNSNKTGPRALNPALKIQCVRKKSTKQEIVNAKESEVKADRGAPL